MVKFKEMPYSVKYKMAQDNIAFFKSILPPFIKENMGDQAVIEHENVLNEGVKSIPENATIEDKYEIAYANWIWMAKNNFSFIRNKMGEDGIKKLKRHEADELKRKNAGPAVSFLNLIRTIAPGYAFVMTNKEFSYQLQWITPFKVIELNKNKAIFDIPRCKVLDFQDTEDICSVGCQEIYPMWVAEQFKFKMAFNRKGKSCTCIVAHLN